MALFKLPFQVNDWRNTQTSRYLLTKLRLSRETSELHPGHWLPKQQTNHKRCCSCCYTTSLDGLIGPYHKCSAQNILWNFSQHKQNNCPSHYRIHIESNLASFFGQHASLLEEYFLQSCAPDKGRTTSRLWIFTKLLPLKCVPLFWRQATFNFPVSSILASKS